MSNDIITHGFKSGLPLEFEIIDVAQVFRHPKANLKKAHRLDFHAIIWFQSGTPTHITDFKAIDIKPNTLLFLKKDTVHSFDTENEFSAKAILFTDSFFCKSENDTKFLKNSILFNDLFSVSAIQLQENNKIIKELFQLMTNELETNKDSCQSEILRSFLYNFILQSERLLQSQSDVEIRKGADYELVVLYKDLIEENFKTQKKVKFYSDNLIVPPKRLSQATSKVLGQTPKEIIENRIILEAKRLLVNSSESIKEISFQLGYDEPTYFVQFFKRHTGITPLEFREKETLS